MVLIARMALSAAEVAGAAALVEAAAVAAAAAAAVAAAAAAAVAAAVAAAAAAAAAAVMVVAMGVAIAVAAAAADEDATPRVGDLPRSRRRPSRSSRRARPAPQGLGPLALGDAFSRNPSGIHGTWRHPTVHGEHT
eukprot:2320782-Prymnesium_polylepis.1